MGGQLSKAGLPGIERGRTRRKTVSSSSSSPPQYQSQHVRPSAPPQYPAPPPVIFDQTRSVPNAGYRPEKMGNGVRRTTSTVAMQRAGSAPSSVPATSQRITRDTAKATAAAIHQRRLDHHYSTPSVTSDDSSSTPISGSPTSTTAASTYARSERSSTSDYGTGFNEEQEYTRHQRQHYVFKQVFGGNIMCTFDKPPRRILDTACGAGFWALEVAQDYPDAQVVALGSTLPVPTKPERSSTSSTMPRLMFPKNVSFGPGSIYSPPFPFPDNTFDLVHQREVGILLPFQYWQPLLADMHRILKPGGILHLVEYDMTYPENCGPLCDRSNQFIRDAAAEWGLNPEITGDIERLLHQIGFQHVEVQRYYVPIGEWPEDEIGLQQGFLMKSVTLQLLKWGKAKMGPQMGIDPDKYDEYCSAIIQELEDSKASACWKVLTARK